MALETDIASYNYRYMYFPGKIEDVAFDDVVGKPATFFLAQDAILINNAIAMTGINLALFI